MLAKIRNQLYPIDLFLEQKYSWDLLKNNLARDSERLQNIKPPDLCDGVSFGHCPECTQFITAQKKTMDHIWEGNGDDGQPQ